MAYKKSLIKEDINRVIESQSYNSTRQLVDSDEEQGVLEQLIDESKPRYPEGFDGLHYLLKTPFRYPPLEYGSRFGSRYEPSIFYGSLNLDTALCETAYYRFRFLFDSEAKLRPSYIPYTSFAVSTETTKGLDLTKGDWKDKKSRISSPVTYKYSHPIGREARKEEIEAILYYSARKTDSTNLAIFTPSVFSSKKIKAEQHWNAYVDYSTVTFTKDGKKDTFNFPLESFLVHGKLPLISS